MALLIPVFLSACAQTRALQERTDAAAAAQGELEASRILPAYPADCRRTSRSGVQVGDRLDTALLQTDAALTRQNARTRRCAAWYDDLKEGFNPD